MKVVVTGSLGNISRPLTIELVQKGHSVTVISSNPEKQKDIEALGATAAIGPLQDVPFLTATFTGADIVYCMIPPNYFNENDLLAYYRKIATNYAEAIQQSGVRRVIHLSSFGAHLDKGTGIILGSHYAEGILNVLAHVSVTHIRPTSFFYNLFHFTGMIKKAGLIAANYGGDDLVLWVSPIDIAAAIAEETDLPAVERKVRYVASDERTCNDVARALGAAIGMPELQWITISDDEMLGGMVGNGVPAHIAAPMVELYACLHSGALAEDYYLHPPATVGKVKLADFAREFAAAFLQK